MNLRLPGTVFRLPGTVFRVFFLFALPLLNAAGTCADPPVTTTSSKTVPAPPVAVFDLGTLGGSESVGCGVNNKGQVVGTSLILGDKAAHAFLYADGKMTDLGTLGGDQSRATALNDSGQVTGTADLKAEVKDSSKGNHKARGKSDHKVQEIVLENPRHHAFLWQQGQMSDLGTSKPDDSEGLAINSTGQVVGKGGPGNYPWSRACFWSGGKLDILDKSELGTSEALAVNAKCVIAGTLNKPGRDLDLRILGVVGFAFADHAVLWHGAKGVKLEARGREVSLANSINDLGWVAGAVSSGHEMRLHACLWREGTLTDFGTLYRQNTVVFSINNTGVIVGGTNPNDLNENGQDLNESERKLPENGGADPPQYAFCCLGSKSGSKLVALNLLIDPASGWELTDAHSISDTGYVTGTGVHNGQIRAYLLKLPPAF